jgi:hypothetical protein
MPEMVPVVWTFNRLWEYPSEKWLLAAIHALTFANGAIENNLGLL